VKACLLSAVLLTHFTKVMSFTVMDVQIIFIVEISIFTEETVRMELMVVQIQ
jgi:hypothetical protein